MRREEGLSTIGHMFNATEHGCSNCFPHTFGHLIRANALYANVLLTGRIGPASKCWGAHYYKKGIRR